MSSTQANSTRHPQLAALMRACRVCDLLSLHRFLASPPAAAPPVLLFGFHRADIERQDTGIALEYLRALGQSTRALHSYADRAYLSVDGYEQDSREIYAIPECRVFFQELAREWGGWLHFLHGWDSSTGVLFNCLVDVRVIRTAADLTTVSVSGPAEIGAAIETLFVGLNAFYSEHGFGEPALKRCSLRTIAMLERVGLMPQSVDG